LIDLIVSYDSTNKQKQCKKPSCKEYQLSVEIRINESTMAKELIKVNKIVTIYITHYE